MTWLAGSPQVSTTKSTRYGFSLGAAEGACPTAAIPAANNPAASGNRGKCRRIFQAVSKIFRLYIQYSTNHSTARTIIASNSGSNEPSVGVNGVVKMATVLCHGMMLCDM
jgi:hypothetical protein